MKLSCFQYDERLFLPEKGIAMGFIISSIITEEQLQYIEDNIYIYINV